MTELPGPLLSLDTAERPWLCQQCIVVGSQWTNMTRVRVFLMALCHSQVTLMLCTDINITETTYSCQFQYEFGNQ